MWSASLFLVYTNPFIHYHSFFYNCNRSFVNQKGFCCFKPFYRTVQRLCYCYWKWRFGRGASTYLGLCLFWAESSSSSTESQPIHPSICTVCCCVSNRERKHQLHVSISTAPAAHCGKQWVRIRWTHSDLTTFLPTTQSNSNDLPPRLTSCRRVFSIMSQWQTVPTAVRPAHK